MLDGLADHIREVHALRERVDYLFVAVMRGDPRFSKPEHASADFDCAGFDAWWSSKGNRVPEQHELAGLD